MEQILEKLNSLNTTVLAALIAATIALIAAIINLILGLLNYKNQKKSLELVNINNQNQKIKDEILNFEKQLTEFYIPFNSYLTQSYLLYTTLRANLPTNFRTLIYLIDNDYEFESSNKSNVKVSLTSQQTLLLNEIMLIEDKLKVLIIEKGGIIKDETLHLSYNPNNNFTDVLLGFDPEKPENLPKEIGLLDLFMVHCTLIKLASNKSLDKDKIELYKSYVYPRELNHKIKEKIVYLQNQILELKRKIK